MRTRLYSGVRVEENFTRRHFDENGGKAYKSTGLENLE